MRVFVTGGSGFIGSHVCETLLAQGIEVISFDNHSSGKNRISGITHIEGDICNLQRLEKAMHGCTHIAHLAALASVPASVADPELSESINLHGTLNVIEAAKANGIKRIVFSSTAAVYGNTSEYPVTESTATSCLSPYAEDKLAAEAALLSSGLEVILLRYFNVHGPRQDPKGAYAAVIPSFIDSLMNHKSPRIFGTGEATRDYVRVQDVAEINLLALTAENNDAVSQVYNVASGSTVSVLELFETIRDLLSEKDESISAIAADFSPPRDGDILHSSASINKARELLKFNPETDHRLALQETVEAYWDQRV